MLFVLNRFVICTALCCLVESVIAVAWVCCVWFMVVRVCVLGFCYLLVVGVLGIALVVWWFLGFVFDIVMRFSTLQVALWCYFV